MSNAVNPTRQQYAHKFQRRTGIDWRSIGYGPFRYAAPAGWLLLASSFRVIAVNYGSLPALFCANVMVLLAAIDATNKVIAGMRGRTSLGELSLTDLLRLALLTGRRLMPLIFAVILVGIVLKLLELNGSAFIMGAVTCIDGIAFDTDGVIAPACATLAGLLIFMTIVAHGTGMETGLADILCEIAGRGRYLVPALAIAFIVLLAASALQDWVRVYVYQMLAVLEFRGVASSVTFYSFVVGFAALRLSLLITIFATALRRSYGRVR